MIETLKHQLADQMERLAIDLLGTFPTTRTRDEVRFGARGALAVRVAGPKRGTFCDFSCDAKGDAIALICHVRKCDTREALRWAQQWLGNAPSTPAPLRPPASPPAAPESPPEPPRTIELARRLWQEAAPPQGTPAEAYLRWRGLALEPGMPIRFHPRAWRNKANGPFGPAMLALMSNPETGAEAGIHCTYICSDGAGKAEGPDAKIMLGSAGIVRLAPDDDIGTGLGLAEGLETSLAVMQRFGWRPVWCTTSAGGISRFPVLPSIQTLTIFADRDAAGINAARTCAANWTKAGREARICLPPAGDFNDIVRGQAA